jgi:DNA-binding NtrC family response regulator
MATMRDTAQAPTGRETEVCLSPSAAETCKRNPANVNDFRISKVLVVDADRAVREQLERLYAQNGYSVIAFSSAEESLRRLEEEDIDFVIADIMLPGMDGVQFISRIHRKYSDLPVVAITAYADIQTAVDVLKLGACDFIMKPFDLAAVLESTRAALENTKDDRQIRQLRLWFKEHCQFSEMLSRTPQMHRVFELIQLAAETDMPVLIHGETGTGKELVANAIHHHSGRRAGPFVALNCGGFPEALLERELFGYDKYAFASAQQAKPGKIRLAHGGTLFLDAIESLSLATQAKLVRVIEDRQVQRLVASRDMHVDVRIMAASNESIKDLMSKGKMESDFYSCINTVAIHLIPLRERPVDIPLLVQNFLRQHPIAKSKKIVGVSDKVLGRLMEYPWPGNIRELQNVIECAILLAPGRIIEEVKLPQAAADSYREKSQTASSSLRQWLREKEKLYLAQKLEDLDGNIGLTAKSCRIGVRTLSRKMRIYGLDKKIFKEKALTVKPMAPGSGPSVMPSPKHVRA